MRCPKCGAFMQEDKDICLMCGTNVKTYVPDSNPNATFSSNNSSAFGSGNDFRTGAFNGVQPSLSNTPVNSFDNKGPFKPAPVKKEDKDIFDFYQENKGLINLVFAIAIVGIIFLSGNFYYKSRTKEVKLEPIIQNLYFKVDESFNPLSTNNSSSVSYAKSGTTGNDCMITITVGSATSNNHVEDYFYQVKGLIEPERDQSNNIVSKSSIYTPADSSAVINGATWYYLNVFYKENDNSDPVLLRNRYLTSMDKGFYYDVQLYNYSNDKVCSASLDSFAKSMQFIDK